MNNLEKKQIKARNGIWFLQSHPALREWNNFLIDFTIETTCKRGHTQFAKKDVQIFSSSKYAEKFRKEFEREYKKYSEEELKTQKALISISVPYKKLFGEEWKFEHIEYWSDLCFFVAMSTDITKDLEPSNWQNCSGVETSGRTFEDMIINTTKKFKKIFGNFSSDDFLTKKEKQNHKEQMPFLFKKIKENPKTSTMVKNKKYIPVSKGELNRRWLKWFMKTEYYKKHWEGSFDEWVKK